MNESVGPPIIGQWYARGDKGELFQVVGRDGKSRTIEIQTFDGELDEIDAEIWGTLPLERSEAPEDWTAPLDNIEVDDLGGSETAMQPADWQTPLQPLRVERESWERTETEDEGDPLGEGAPVEDLSEDLPEPAQRSR